MCLLNTNNPAISKARDETFAAIREDNVGEFILANNSLTRAITAHHAEQLIAQRKRHAAWLAQRWKARPPGKGDDMA